KNRLTKKAATADLSSSSAGRLRLALWGLLLGALISGLGCASSKSHEKKLVKNGLTLKYISKISAGDGVAKMPFDHPAKIPEEKVRNHLLALRFEPLTILGKERPVYTKKDVKRITRLIAKALQRAKENTLVSYEVETSDGKTVGDVFLSDNKINWRFKKIRGLTYSNNDSPSARGGLAALWRLTPKKGQHLYVSKKFLGSKVWDNWIVADLDLPQQKTKGSSGKKRTSKRGNSPDKDSPGSRTNSHQDAAKAGSVDADPGLEEKLEFLKGLRRKKLIDDKEFQRKRRELLDKYL
ncbi:MAG: hypothetical protein ACE5GQ_00680, partial [Nitrospinales bacterium]